MTNKDFELDSEFDIFPSIDRISDNKRITFTERGAADYLSLSPETLRIYRKMRKGPNYYKIERRVVYSKYDLDIYLDRHKVSLISEKEKLISHQMKELENENKELKLKIRKADEKIEALKLEIASLQ